MSPRSDNKEVWAALVTVTSGEDLLFSEIRRFFFSLFLLPSSFLDDDSGLLSEAKL